MVLGTDTGLVRAKQELLTELQVLLAELLEATEQTGGRPHFPRVSDAPRDSSTEVNSTDPVCLGSVYSLCRFG